MIRNATLLLLPIAALTTSLSAQNRIGSGDVSELYKTYCANCHGENLRGGQGSSLVDGIWAHGSSDADIARVIAEGIPQTEMVPWKHSLSEKQIRSLVIYIREQGQMAAREALPEDAFKPKQGVFNSEKHDFTLEEVGQGEGILWAIEFLPDASMLVTQRDGVLWHFKDGERNAIEGTPEVWQHGQGGLLEVQIHPEYAENGWIYLGYSENVGGKDDGKDAGMTAVVRGRISDGKWIDQEEIYHAPEDLHSAAGAHYGTRFVFQDGYLFFGIGDRGRQDQAQELGRPNGKIHRIHDDGRIPADNPFLDDPKALATIWSYGHRNPQGLDAHPETGALWEVEHGPRGGDETNLIHPGLNYGWPIATYGMNYNGTPITEFTDKDGVEAPKHYWVPSIAICGIDFYEGDKFPEWKNNLFVTGMASQELHRLTIEGDQVVADEIVFKGQGRIRDVYSGPDGFLYILITQQSPRAGAIYRLKPAS
ncbi:PQQ-dependent sugar dehydrogenase [Pelagicoccus sp. SDUM812002]|uniref:PQQ-dependent sugar dehydrogenase n=1 Tax=Pelagicoccus sp. SDUM812002 TaxID=3041266 RepID=UPI00280DB6FC|nr:PQQ-dependent sugar dehydrogenase [Pelagicoccus sp. SDUM812002]MDQ8186260.1 PQQ-dependent sugar dehydrogenase [Pelagicoccus sp. SDUM812002]